MKFFKKAFLGHFFLLSDLKARVHNLELNEFNAKHIKTKFSRLVTVFLRSGAALKFF